MGVVNLLSNVGTGVVGDFKAAPGPGQYGTGPCEVHVTGTFVSGNTTVQVRQSYDGTAIFSSYMRDNVGAPASGTIATAVIATGDTEHVISLDTNFTHIQARTTGGDCTGITVDVVFATDPDA